MEHHNHQHADHDTHNHVDHSGHETIFRRRFWISLILSIPVLLFSPSLQDWFGFSLPSLPGDQWITPAFALLVFLIGGIPFLQMAVPEVKQRKPGMMLLISLAISVSFLYSFAAFFFQLGEGFYWELVTLIDIMLLGHWIEMRSVRQASGSLDELAKLMPDEAERLDSDNQPSTVPVSELRKGDVVLVRPGASIPVDGEVIEGATEVNESMITGESRPVKKQAGSAVIAGSINGDGSLRVRVAAIGEQTALAGIMRLVNEAQNSKSGTQILADRAAGWLFYIALASALVTGIAWTIAQGFDSFALQRVVTVLVIACPHALGLAVPLVVAISTSQAAKNGLLIRDRKALEAARLVDVVVFDKTGTLTEGKVGLADMSTFGGWKEADALGLAAAIEGDSEHLLALAIRDAAQRQDAALAKVSDFEALKGRGVQANYAGKRAYLGGPQLLKMLAVELSQAARQFRDTAEKRGQTVVYLIVADEMVAAFALADIVRSESKATVEALQRMGKQVAIITGDSQAVAEAVAAELGIDQVFAEVLPENKDQKIIELQNQGKRVAMVGDGVNDAPALARADVGLAIGSGTDVAVESAGIILVNSNPLDVLKIFELSRATYSKMQQNLIWASGYNLFAIPLAAGALASFGILLSPAVGALLMSVSTIVVAVNAQLLRIVNLNARA